MPPRIIQWQPVEAFDEIYLIPRAGQAAALAARARELGVQLVTSRATIYAPGTNIDGGYIDVDDELTIARLGAEATLEDIARATAELAPLCEATRYLVLDYDGARAIHAPHLLEDIGIVDVADWRQHLVREEEPALLVAAVTEPITARGVRAGDRADLEALIALAPAELEPHQLLAQLCLAEDRLDDAAREALQVLALDVRAYQKAPAHALLAEIASRRGAFADALVHARAAREARFSHAAQVAVGVAALRAGKPDEATKALVPAHEARTLFEHAAAMCALGRTDDARAYLEIALAFDPRLLAPVPANQWPKPPDTAWTAPHAELAALVAAATPGNARG